MLHAVGGMQQAGKEQDGCNPIEKIRFLHQEPLFFLDAAAVIMQHAFTQAGEIRAQRFYGCGAVCMLGKADVYVLVILDAEAGFHKLLGHEDAGGAGARADECVIFPDAPADDGGNGKFLFGVMAAARLEFQQIRHRVQGTVFGHF